MLKNNKDWKQQAIALADTGDISWRAIARELQMAKSTVSDYLRQYFKTKNIDSKHKQEKVPTNARILLLDLECAPTTAYVW